MFILKLSVSTTVKLKYCREYSTCMMASFYYQDQNAVSGLFCQANFSNCLFIPKREDKFKY